MRAPLPRSSRRIAATAAGALALVGVTTLPGLASGAPTRGDLATSPVAGSSAAKGDAKGFYDARAVAPKEMTGALATANTRTASAGSSATLDLDPLTLTPRNLTTLDGYLTGASAAAPATVVMRYVASHLTAMGLTSADLSTFALRTSYQDVAGIWHLSWTQSVGGRTVFGNGLKANVTKDGRIISLQGSPVSGLVALAAKAPAGSLDATAARAGAAKDVLGSADATASVASRSGSAAVWSNHDYAKPVWFLTSTGLRPGWSTYVQTTKGPYLHVLDAASGGVLYRQSTVDHEKGDSYVYDNYPGAAKGGDPTVVNFIAKGWLRDNATWLDGKYVKAWSDVNDDNVANPDEKTAVPGTATGASFPLARYGALSTCNPSFQCTWNPATKFSWKRNQNADAANAFYLANSYHDYLEATPFGFTAQAGNFENSGGDPVLLQALDGADTANGLPDGNHIDNANMNTPPDGTPPTMQMYLWHFPGTTVEQDPSLATSGAFDASVVLHEYTHGLSNRLVVDASGVGALDSLQAGSMGEAWSDYYALDYLVTKGFITDTSKAGDVLEGIYVTDGAGIRTEAIDCPVTTGAASCTSIYGVKGGYTYADVPTIGGSPEVHSSGEVWAQTLWDLRSAFGHDVADSLITRGMTLSPTDPSMLDMRNAIIKADQVVYGNAHAGKLWKLFAARGMGWFAGTIDSGDAHPAEDFHTRPAAQTPRTTVAGRVTDPANGNAPVVGVRVVITGHGSGYTSDYTAVTDGSGRYVIGNVYPGVYAKVVVAAKGYELVSKAVNTSKPGSGDFSVRRDWAASSGGASITDYNGPNYSSFGCGPGGAIDLSQGSGWGSTTGDDQGTPTGVFKPKYVVIALPQAVDVSSLAVDPSSTCGDPGSSSTGQYRIDTSKDGKSWTAGASGAFTPTNQGQYNSVTLKASARSGVRYVKFWILGNQVPDFATNCPSGPYAGCVFTDLTEVEVFGNTSG